MRRSPLAMALLGCAGASNASIDAGGDAGDVATDSGVARDELYTMIAAAPESSWLQVNRNRFDEVWTPVLQRAMVNGTAFGEPRKIITAWGAMTWDGNRKQLVIWGGGHADYAGNEVYRWSASTLEWERASLPSALRQASNAMFFAIDGAMAAPISSHPYDNLEFLPGIDRLITFGGAAYNTGGPFVADDGVTRTGPYLWDPSCAGADVVGGTSGSQVRPALYPEVTGAQAWSNRNTVVTRGTGAQRPNGFVDATSAYALDDGVESLLLAEAPTTGGDLFRYTISSLADPGADAWELIGEGNQSYGSQGAGAYDPTRRLFLRTARVNGEYGIVMWNVATPGATNQPIRFNPVDSNGGFVITLLHGMDFDPVRSVFALWDGGDAVWYLVPPAGNAFKASGWTLTRAPTTGATHPALQSTTGVLGKWKYIASHDVMIGLGHGREGQVWVYKPVGWSPPTDIAR